MFHQDQFLGVILVYFHEEERSFSESEISVLKALTELGAQAITNARLYREVLDGREHLKQLSQQLVEVQEAERRRLALELHDELGQVLNGIKISLDMIPLQADLSMRERLVDRASMATGNLIERVRKMSLDLRPSLLDEMGLYPTLTWFLRNYKEQSGGTVQFNWSGPKQRLDPLVETTAYRIIQEAITNILRHAGNQKVEVSIGLDDDSLHIQVADHGCGFDVEKALRIGKSTGLSGMRERARLLGGELIIESIPETGTRIEATLPLTEPSSENVLKG